MSPVGPYLLRSPTCLLLEKIRFTSAVKGVNLYYARKIFALLVFFSDPGNNEITAPGQLWEFFFLVLLGRCFAVSKVN